MNQNLKDYLQLKGEVRVKKQQVEELSAALRQAVDSYEMEEAQLLEAWYSLSEEERNEVDPDKHKQRLDYIKWLWES